MFSLMSGTNKTALIDQETQGINNEFKVDDKRATSEEFLSYNYFYPSLSLLQSFFLCVQNLIFNPKNFMRIFQT